MRSLILVGLAFCLAGCVTAEEQRARNLALDNRNCAASGFAPGSEAMAQCMATASSARSADQDRQAQWQAQQQAMQAQRERDQAARDAHNRQIADQEARDRENRIRATMNRPQPGIPTIQPVEIKPKDLDPMGTGNGGDAQPPTASRIPGMNCTGTGDEATCDAR